MAKKARRRRSASPRTYAQAGKQTSQPQPTAEAVSAQPSPATGKKDSAVKASSKVDLAAEYTYVGLDLRRLFLVAGAMLVVLIVLNFLIQ